MIRERLFVRVASVVAVAWLLPVSAAAPKVLWQIGRSDGGSLELALAPGGYRQFSRDPLFVVGRSDARADWPYVQPGPDDAWAGRRPHRFEIVFGMKHVAAGGSCRIVADLLDTHGERPPQVSAEVNGTTFERRLPRGNGAALDGDLAKGRPSSWTIDFPCGALHPGNNHVALTTLAGSWMLYDSVRLEAPAEAEAVPPADELSISTVEVAPVWLKRGPMPVQPIRVVVRRVGPPLEAAVGAEAGDPVRATLAQGTTPLELVVPAAEQPRDLRLTLTAAGGALDARTVTVKPPGVRDLWLLPHSHVDIGYTHHQAEVVGIQVENLERAMLLAEATAANPDGARFTWNPEAVWTLELFLSRASREEKDAFVRGVQAGQIGIDGLFANLLTGLCRPEELAQSLTPATRIAALARRPVLSASTCDVPGLTWGLVPLLAQAGIKYLALGPNATDRVGTIHQWDDRPFYWRSASGRERVLCWIVDNYHHAGELEPQVLGHLARLEGQSFPYDASFMFWVGSWPNGSVDNAPPDEQLAAKAVAWNAKYAAPRVRVGLVAAFFEEFERKHAAGLEEVPGDLTPYWEDGAGSSARETGMNRSSADRLSQAATLFAMRDRGAYPAERFQEAWRSVLLYSEHTWGADRSIEKPDDPFTLDQWRVKKGFAESADGQSRALLASALPPASAALGAVDVYNTTQWDRTALVVVPPELGAAGIVDERGRPLASQRRPGGELAFLARGVPAFGARRYRVLWRPPIVTGAGEGARASGTVLQTPSLRVELDPATGAIRSLRLLGSNREFVDSASGLGLNAYRYVLGEDTAGATANGPVKITVVENGPLVAALRVESEAPGCNRLVREVRVVDGFDRVELSDTVDRKAVRVKDAVHFGFAFAVPGGTVRMETPWAVVRPNADQAPGANRNWFTVQRWVDVSNADYGITLAPLDAPLLEVGGMTASLLGSVAADRWMTRANESPILYSWVQNNHWHTNYRADQAGETTFRYVLEPHAGPYAGAAAARLGMETSRPLVVAASDTRTRLPEPLLTVSSDNVLVETVKVSEDGRAVIVRLFGVGGKPEAVTLRWRGWKPRSIWRSDVAEKRLEHLGATVDVPAYGVVHLRAE